MRQQVLQEQQELQLRHAAPLPGREGGPPPAVMRRIRSSGLFTVFFIMLWRAMHLYEMADQLTGTARRYMFVVPSLGLLLGNLACLCMSLAPEFGPKKKQRMKAMLSFDMTSEGVLLIFNLLSLLTGGDFHIPREEYVGRLLVNAWFLAMCMNFSRMHWI